MEKLKEAKEAAFADDTQLGLYFIQLCMTAVLHLSHHLAEIGSWRRMGWLKLKPEKTEVEVVSWGKQQEEMGEQLQSF